MQSFFLGDQLMKLIEIYSRSEKVSLEEFAATLDAAQPEGLGAEENDIIALDDPIQDLPAQTRYHELKFDDILYHAAWDPEHEAVVNFMANGRTRQDDAHRWLWDEDLRAGRTKPEEHLSLDLSLLDMVGTELTNQLNERVRCGVIGSSRFMHRRSVDLPDPDGPMRHTISPAPMAKSMPMKSPRFSAA